MSSRKVLPALTLAIGLIAAASALAVDFTQPALPTQAYDQGTLTLDPGTTYYSFVRNKLKTPMGHTGDGVAANVNDDTLVQTGKGVAVELVKGAAYNIHVNYNSKPTSGRSYGWTDVDNGMVGDWSDKTYLQNIWTVVSTDGNGDLSNFYKSMIQLVGSSDATLLASLTGMTKRVESNFLAIYTAEEYRATLGTRNWDDAIFDVSLLAAFHAGQVAEGMPITLYYGKASAPKFTSDTEVQGPGVDGGPTKGTPKKADMTDYWQYTATPSEKNSGINETRVDFAKLGQAITTWEKTVGKGPGAAQITAIEAIVRGKGANVFEDTTQYYTQTPNNADAAVANDLGTKVAAFELQIKQDAKAISQWITANP